MGFINSKSGILHLFFIHILFDADAVLSLQVLDSQIPQRPLFLESETESQIQELPLLSSPDVQDKLSHLFLQCSNQCSGLPDCLGISIYKLNTESAEQSFTCLPTINDDANSVQPGKLFYKIMFRDKLPKVQRRHFIVRNSREIHSSTLRKRENSQMVEPPSAIAATKIQPIKIDPLFTETTTVAGATVDPKSVVVPNTDPLFGENKPPSTTTPSEIMSSSLGTNDATLTTTTGDLASILSNETSSLKTSDENSSGASVDITTVKSSDIAPVKINPLFTETTTISAADVTVHPESSAIVSVDPLFETSSSSTQASVEKGSQEVIISAPASSSTTVPILAPSEENPTTAASLAISNSNPTSCILENTLKNVVITTTTATPCSKHIPSLVSTTETSLNIEPVRIDPLFSETTTVSGASGVNVPLHAENSTVVVDVDSLFETNSSSSVHNSNSSSSLSTSSIPVTETTSSSILSEIHPVTVSPTLSSSSDNNSTNSTIVSSIPETTTHGTITAVENSTEENSKSSSVNETPAENITCKNKTSENLVSSTTENIDTFTPSLGEHVVTDIPKIILEESSVTNTTTEQPLFANNNLIGKESPSPSENVETTMTNSSVVQFGEHANETQDKSAISQSEKNLDNSMESQTCINPNFPTNEGQTKNISQTIAKNEDNIKEENMTKGKEQVISDSDSNNPSSISSGHEQIVSTTEILPLPTTETVPTSSISEDNNSKRIFVGQSSAENNYLPYASSHSHNAEVSEVKNEDGTTTIILKTVIKIHLEDEDEDSPTTDSPVETATTVSSESAEEPVTLKYLLQSQSEEEGSPKTDSPQQTTVSSEIVEEPVTTFKQLLQSQYTDTECLFQDTERYLRNIRGTAFSMLNGQPTMLSFVSGHQSHCVGTLMKNGTKGMRHIESIIPGFPSDIEVDAAGFLNGRLYVIDASKEQNVWSFEYDFHTRRYSEVPMRQSLGTSTKQEFLQLCQIDAVASDTRIKAFAQVSLHDHSCIIFDESRTPILSDNASEEAQSVSKAISFLLEAEFINYVEAVFAWLDESFISSVYVYVSNGDLYRLFRNATTDFQWQNGNYELLPYPQLPLKP